MDKVKLAKIKEVFEKALVEVVYLFGSQATGEAGPASDYDFAILNQTGLDKSERLYLSGYLMDKLFVFTGYDKADVVPLEDVPLDTRYLVVSEGKLLLNRNSSRKEAFERSTRQEFIVQVPKIRENFQKFAKEVTASLAGYERKRTQNTGFTLIEILIVIAVLIITAAGGVVLWEKKTTPTVTPTPTPSISKEITPVPTKGTKMPWEDSVCGNDICEPCENECCNYPCITDVKGSLMCPPPTCLGYCPQDCQDTPITTLEKDCAVNGESPSNFDMTTGKIIPGGKPCCEGLKAIGPRTPQDALNKGICMKKTGSPGICRPCGNGICNSEYEDRCNCPEDCK